ncbi:PP2C family protein-serine/threonine phosphatase [Nocardioides dongxiaopingii]|uniref:PP2C family protein-serine/threonine phosphatase n=1 Tax=Nocardioides dongxiaopingii TaxID=2576036 RepID=UPI001FE6A05E|nr:PP2C family protein-serine/threonine phosphatase [Nocardioides dongxiaopingii]
MSSSTLPSRAAPGPSPWRRWSRARRRSASAELRIGAALCLFSVTVTVLVMLFPSRTPFSSLVLPVVLGSILLGPRLLPWFVGFDMVMLTICVSRQESLTGRVLGAATVQLAVACVVLLANLQRARLGVAGLRGESMFVDLRDRILDQAHIPDLPAGWQVESALHSAGGTAFAGDFVVASRSADGTSLQVVVVDVSGKGEAAGTRALLLSGAFGGLLGALPPAGFLPAANAYLLRQAWDEGFATAIHLCLDLTTGAFEVRTAGHPPAVHRASGTGRWAVLHTEGPVLGLLDDLDLTVRRGRLDHGDAVLLYTDGIIEEPCRDLDLGIDRMMGGAESVLRGSFVGAAERLTTTLGSRDDDRAMVVVRRT